MAAELFHSATEYVANELTILRGDVSDITAVGVFHTTNPNEIPEVADFTTVQLIDGVNDPGDPLAEDGVIDVLSLIGPRNGDETLTAGDYQRYVLITTAAEDIIRRVDEVVIL